MTDPTTAPAGDPPAAGSLPSPSAAPRRNPAALPWYTAVWNAICSHDLDFYPRVKDNSGEIISLDSKEMLGEFGMAAKDWSKLKADDLEEAIKLARQSLDESKDQTEYQDQKATRLLTVTTFLTALSGALFTRFNDAYPLEDLGERTWLEIGLLLTGYAIFGLFLLSAICGALVTFHATRTRFKYPKQEAAAREDGDPKSRLFYSGIIGVRPRAWASAFVGSPAAASAPPPLRDDIQQSYFRDLIGEAYLVAAKTADKLRYLEPAQSLLSVSLKCLLLWLLVLPVIAVSVEVKKAPVTPLPVTVTMPTAPFAVDARVTSLPAPPAPQTPPLPAPGTRPENRAGNAGTPNGGKRD